MNINEKYNALISRLTALPSVAVAFSAGVDSTLLLYAAKEAKGKKAAAVTAFSPLMPEKEQAAAREFCKQNGIKQIEIDSSFVLPLIKGNPQDRCYICKKAVMSEMLSVARDGGYSVLAEGSNADDSLDYRPGERAIAELKIISPLKDAGLTKAQIRELAREKGLAVWNKPAYASLATRFEKNATITPKGLAAIENAEEYLHSLGFSQVRVRVHGKLARIETEKSDLEKILDPVLLYEINEKLKSFGFRYVSLDLGGYKTGNMN